MFMRTIGLALALTASASAAVLGRQATNSTNEACSKAREATAFGIGSQIAPSKALACLASVPLDLHADVELVDYLTPMLELQSTLGYLKSPPDGYLFPSVDLVGGLKQMREKLTTGGYKSQLEFAWDLNRLYNQAYDGHFDYKPALLNIFGFQSSRNLLSISKDGIELPKVYDREDMERGSNKGYSESEVVSIDGMPVVDYLQIVGSNSALQDPDAQYNNLFVTSATTARGGGGYFRSGGYVELPDFSVYTYANGTSRSYPNYAVLQQDLTGIQNGHHLHLAYEMPAPAAAAPKKTKAKVKAKVKSTVKSKLKAQKSKVKSKVKAKVKAAKDKVKAAAAAATTTAPVVSRPTVTGYPYPVVKHYNDYVAGYFLNDTNHQDTAVLSIFAFSPRQTATRTTTEIGEFRRVVREFIAECRKNKRTKLIIDVQANGGGLLFQAYELYRNLFPKANPPFDGTRFRASEAFNVVGRSVYGTLSERSVLNNMLDRDLKRYADWKAMFGPFETTEDRNTNLLRYNFSDVSTTGEAGFVVSGYAAGDKPPEPHFEAKDILLVTDGFCASTCSILARLLTHEQGVRALALGGRPLKAAMQAVGGVKGAQVMRYAVFQQALYTALRTLPPGTTAPTNLPSLEAPPLLPAIDGLQFNLRNAYRDAQAAVPQQFVYEAAHCRRFYTYEMTRDPVRVWTAAAEVAFKGGRCAEGSSAGRDQTMDSKPPGLDRAKVFSKIAPYDGPGSKAYADRKAAVAGVSAPKTNRRDEEEEEAGQATEGEGFLLREPSSLRSRRMRRRWEAARRARRELRVRGLSPHELELLNRKPQVKETQGWWEHPGY